MAIDATGKLNKAPETQDDPARPAIKISPELAGGMLEQFGSDYIQKKPGRITALKLDFAFEIGDMQGTSGSYLVREDNGVWHIWDKEYLEKGFRPTRKSAKPKEDKKRQ
jgi:hypothetical protein